MNELKEIGIGTSIYYPQPVPRMKYYSDKYNLPADSYKVASIFSDSSIALPVGPHLDIEDMNYIGEGINSVLDKNYV